MATIRKTKSGRFNAQIRLANHKPISKTFETKAEAKTWAQKHEAQLRQIPVADEQTPSFHELGMSYCRLVLAGRTSQKITIARIEKLSAAFPNQLSSITQQEINAYRLKRLQEVKPVTVRDELQLINRIYLWAYRELLLDPDTTPNPCRNIPIPQGSKPRNKVVSRKELAALLRELTPTIAAVVEIAFETAMRRSEITKLTPRNLQLDDRTLMVIDGKTGDRIVPLTTRAVAILKQAVLLCPNPDGRLFQVAPHSVTTAVRRARRKLGLSEDIRLHQMRHTRITEVAKKGFNQPQIMMVSGHRDSRSVQRYTHLNVRDVVELLE